MDNHLSAVSALRTIECAAVVPRDSDERRALLGAFKALYRLATPAPTESGGTENASPPLPGL
jgi:hypothetical protein